MIVIKILIIYLEYLERIKHFDILKRLNLKKFIYLICY